MLYYTAKIFSTEKCGKIVVLLFSTPFIPNISIVFLCIEQQPSNY